MSTLLSVVFEIDVTLVVKQKEESTVNVIYKSRAYLYENEAKEADRNAKCASYGRTLTARRQANKPITCDNLNVNKAP